MPSEDFNLRLASVYVFQFVNPPWGTINPQVIETWGKNDIAIDASYFAPDGSGKSFTVTEMEVSGTEPPQVGAPWKQVTSKGQTLFEHDVPGYGTGVAEIKKGIMYLVSGDVSGTNGFHLSQLEQVLASLRVHLHTAPDLIKTQTFGFTKAPTGVPFVSLMPSKLPFKWSTRTAEGVDALSLGGKKGQQHMGRLTLTYGSQNTQLKIIESLGMKYANPAVAAAQNGVDVMLKDGQKAIYFDGGPAVAFMDGGSGNHKMLTWTINTGVNVALLASANLTQEELLTVANSLLKTK